MFSFGGNLEGDIKSSVEKLKQTVGDLRELVNKGNIEISNNVVNIEKRLSEVETIETAKPMVEEQLVSLSKRMVALDKKLSEFIASNNSISNVEDIKEDIEVLKQRVEILGNAKPVASSVNEEKKTVIPQRLTQKQEDIYTLYKSGLSLTKIAKELGCSIANVSKVMQTVKAKGY